MQKFAKSSDADAAARSRWFVNPVVDILFCCGGVIWLLAAVFSYMQFASIDPNILLIMMPVLGSFVLADPHNAATLVRLYGDSDLSKKMPLLRYAAPVIFAGLAVACMANLPLLSIALRVYLIFIAQHTTMQAYGVALAYCQKQGFSTDARLRDILKRAFLSIAIYAMAHQFSLPLPGLTFRLSTFFEGFATRVPELPSWILHATGLFVGFALLELICALVTRAHCKNEHLPLPVALLLMTCMLIFLMPRDNMQFLWLFVPAFFHATQYICVTGRYTMNRIAQMKGLETTPSFLSNEFFGYGLQIFAVGLTLFVLVPAIPKMIGIDYLVSFAAIFCAINLHHFCADFVLWRLRDPALKKLIVS